MKKSKNKEISLKGKIGGQGKKKDSATSLIFQSNENFAEVFNHTVFALNPVSALKLSENSDIKETAFLQVTEFSHTTLTRYRDITKYLGNDQTLAILGIENQDRECFQMPFRALEMDYINYARQIRIITDRNDKAMKESAEDASEVPLSSKPNSSEFLGRFYKEDKLIPCITLVVYWGTEPWQGPLRLSDMFMESPWTQYASDYQMHLLDVQRINDAELNSYGDELKVVFGFVKYARNKKQLKDFISQNEKAFSNVSSTVVDAIAELTHSKELACIKPIYTADSQEGRNINMCQALREWMEDSKEEGRIEGRMEEQVNTEREKKRADIAEQRALRAEQELKNLKIQFGLI
ncbi:MAG: Rpn family recombination-promoting nuclease/putative transposase [Lachnospiraceae bacterium]|nr:Rpn family recombination-promoting nuclease/putative transposase [Lachnospiraceae bacterium]